MFKKLFYYKVIYTDFLPLAIYDAQTICVPFVRLALVLIRPKFKYDKALLNHELTHVIQHFKNPISNVFNYLFNKEYRFKAEAEAYSIQYVTVYDVILESKIDEYVYLLIKNYKIKDLSGYVKTYLKSLIVKELELKHTTNKYETYANLNIS